MNLHLRKVRAFVFRANWFEGSIFGAKSIDFHHFPSFSIISHGFSIMFHHFSWIFHHFSWIFHHFSSFSIIFHGFSIIFHGFSIIFHHFPSFFMDFPSFFMDFPSFSIIFHGFLMISGRRNCTTASILDMPVINAPVSMRASASCDDVSHRLH